MQPAVIFTWLNQWHVSQGSLEIIFLTSKELRPFLFTNMICGLMFWTLTPVILAYHLWMSEEAQAKVKFSPIPQPFTDLISSQVIVPSGTNQ